MSINQGRKRGRPVGSKNKNKLAPVVADLFSVNINKKDQSPLPEPQQKAIAAPLGFSQRSKPTPSPVFDTYWRFACLRQDLFYAKLRKPNQPPWTDDPILSKHKFTNAYRASDRVSQYLISHVIRNAPAELSDVTNTFFRTILFKIFNKIETWQLLEEEIGTIQWSDFEITRYGNVLTHAIESGRRIYSAAYIMPSPGFGFDRKHMNHLHLIKKMMDERLPERLNQQGSLEGAFQSILSYQGIGPFLAYQYAIDLNYGTVIDASENDFVMPGPGALDGIKKCFSDPGDYSPAAIIRYTHDIQKDEFRRLGLRFVDLWGRSLHLIDCQNLFCEVDKYARVMHPDIKGVSDRTRIKQMYRPGDSTIRFLYPKKWGLDEIIASDPRYDRHGSAL